ncbi:virulence factor MviM [Bacillus thuringiensis serovar yunnanensis]|nr:virulence factor MviM [Bacillus thuringiensis serovar yunnanensis]
MRKPRIGMIGLGGIAQKAYLPIVTKETDWTFVGAFSPNETKRKLICEQYRIEDFNSLSSLAEECDAIFVHSSTSTHFEIISTLLSKGVDVYVDKPLAETIEQAEKLVQLSEKYKRKLMVGFNRRFAPIYVQVKAQAKNIASVRFEKHRTNSVGPYSYEFTMLDDYLHVVDTVRWLSSGDLNVIHGTVNINAENYLMYAGHTYIDQEGTTFFTDMHRKAGTNIEKLEVLTEGSILRVKNINTLEIESNNRVTTSTVPSWDTTLKQRGFEGAVQHFIDCLQNDEQPIIDGMEGLKSQLLVNQLLQEITK